MSVGVVKQVLSYLEHIDTTQPINILWHSGEPTASGVDHFYSLIEPLDELFQQGKLRFHIQTNATLLSEAWCKLFLDYKFNVGVSIDGPDWATVERKEWGGKPAYKKIREGIDILKAHKIPFSALAVINRTNIERASEFYSFFAHLGCEFLAINIEELEGKNTNIQFLESNKVKKFWETLFGAWLENPVIKIREFDNILVYIDVVLNNSDGDWNTYQRGLLPTIAYNGDVYLLSPEFSNIKSSKYRDFIVGNILDEPLQSLLDNALDVEYVQDAQLGIESCKLSCQYFGICRGGFASNKYFENGTTNSTETYMCKNSVQIPMEIVLRMLD